MSNIEVRAIEKARDDLKRAQKSIVVQCSVIPIIAVYQL